MLPQATQSRRRQSRPLHPPFRTTTLGLKTSTSALCLRPRLPRLRAQIRPGSLGAPPRCKTTSPASPLPRRLPPPRTSTWQRRRRRADLATRAARGKTSSRSARAAALQTAQQATRRPPPRPRRRVSPHRACTTSLPSTSTTCRLRSLLAVGAASVAAQLTPIAIAALLLAGRPLFPGAS